MDANETIIGLEIDNNIGGGGGVKWEDNKPSGDECCRVNHNHDHIRQQSKINKSHNHEI